MIEYIVKPCKTEAAYQIIVKKGEFEKIVKKTEKMKEFIVVKNQFITILKVKDLQISILDRGKIIFRGAEREDMVRKLFRELFLSDENKIENQRSQ